MITKRIHKKVGAIFLTGWNFFVAGSIWAQSSREEPATMPPKIYDKLAPVTVNIVCDNNKNGSGVIIGITPQGRALILTSCHVIATDFDGDPKTVLEFHKALYVKSKMDNIPLPALILKTFVNEENDLALISSDRPVLVNRTIGYNLIGEIKPGQKIAALGYPSSLDQLALTMGSIISMDSSGSRLAFNAPVKTGNSGGPLIDNSGRMIGMVTDAEVGGGGYASALHMNLILSIVEVWLKKIKLQERWQLEKNPSIIKRMYTDWRFIAGETLLAAGGIYLLMQKDPGFPLPPDRPSTGN